MALRQRSQAVNALASQSEQVLTLLLNAETGVRGYALTGDASFLEPYQEAVSEAPGAVTSWLTNAPRRDRPRRCQGRGGPGQPWSFQRLGDIRQGVSSGKSGRRSPPSSPPTRRRWTSCARLNSIQANEAATLNTRTDSVDFLHSVLETIDVAGLGIGVIGGITAMVLFVRAIARRIGVVGANAHRLGVSEPLLPMPPAADEIGQLGSELEEASTLLTQRNMDLVRFHAAAVDAAQAADDTLAQMSHELRTPLDRGDGLRPAHGDVRPRRAGQRGRWPDSPCRRAHAEDYRGGPHTPARPAGHRARHQHVDIEPLVDEVLSLLRPLAAHATLR